MPRPPLPLNEVERIRALLDCDVLDTPQEQLFDDITTLAAELCQTPIAIITLLDQNRQWFKSAYGLEISETPRDYAFCAYTIQEDSPFVVEDAENHPLTFDNPLVTDKPGFKFYAGITLRSVDGYALGALCVIDLKPRKITDKELNSLKKLANQASMLLQMRNVTRKQYESKKQLEESHEKLSLLSRYVPGLLFQFKKDPQGNFSMPYASESLREIYRIEPQDVEHDANKLLEMIHPEDKEAIKASIEISAKRMTPFKQDCRICFPDGETKWVNGHSYPISQQDGSIIWCGYINDITRQKAIFEEQNRVKLQLEAIMNSSTEVAVVACDLQGKIKTFNRGAELMLGYTSAEVVEKLTPEIFHLAAEVEERGRQLTRETGRTITGFDVFVEAVRHKKYEKREWTCIRKDGAHITVELVQTGIRDANDVLTGFLGIANDITNSKRDKENLKFKQERLELALKGGDLGLWDWNVETGVVHYDSYWQTVLGMEPDSGLSDVNQCTNGIHPDDVQEVMKKVEDHFAELTPSYEAEYRYKHKNGHYIWILARGRVSQRDQYGRPLRMIGTKADITKRELAEFALKNREQELIQARSAAESACKSKSDFLANMSHEIRTPLTAMLGYADLMLDQDVDQQTLQNHLGIIKKSGSHLLTIINDILDLSKIESGKMKLDYQHFALLDVIQEVISFFQVRAQAKYLQLHTEILNEVPETIYSDPVRLRQILINLLGNAIKFTERGTVKISVGYQHTGTPQLNFRISDTGIGISPEQMKGLFEPFAQADNSITRKFGGTGLGLTICRRMANLLEGDITVESKPKIGSTFSLTINPGDVNGVPKVSSFHQVSVENKIYPAEQQVNGTVLLVEDNIDNQRLISMFLQKAGMFVETADNGQVALDKILCNPMNKIGLIIMDMQMPVMDGCTAISILRERGFLLPIISLTANAMQEDREKCIKAGANEFLTKPVDRTLLITMCRDLLGKKLSINEV